MMRYFLMGDTHGNLFDLFNNTKMLNENCTLIILGDFGFIWDSTEAEKNIKKIEELPCQIAFIDGNHENFPLISQLETIEEWNEGKVGRIGKNIVHLLRGEIYNLNGKIVGVCGGANSVDLWHRVEGLSWWKEEEITDQDIANFKSNLVKVDNKVDVVLSHDAPTTAIPLVKLFSGVNDGKISNCQNQLQKIYDCITFDKWFFGHWHIDKRIDDKFTCLFHNLIELV